MKTRLLLSLVLATGACGDSGSNNRDADASPDDDTDAEPDPDAMPLPVRVVAFDDEGVALVGAKVFFLAAADDAVLAELDTDAGGVAEALVPAGSSVTLVPQAAGATIYTWLDVQPGEQLRVGIPGSGILTTVTVPIAGGANQYVVRTSCGGGSEADPMVVLSLERCDSTVDLVAQARNGATRFGTIYAPDTALSATVDLTAQPYAADQTINASFTNAPDDNYQLAVLLADGVFAIDTDAQDVIIAGGTAAITATVANLPGVDLIQRARFTNNTTAHTVMQRGSAATPLDVGSGLVHDFVTASFDFNTRSFTWTSAAGTAGDGAFVQLTHEPDTTGDEYLWNVVGGGDTGSVRLPVLPASSGVLPFLPEDDYEVELVMLYRVAGGAAAVRPVAFIDLDSELTLIPDVGSASIAVYRQTL